MFNWTALHGIVWYWVLVSKVTNLENWGKFALDEQDMIIDDCHSVVLIAHLEIQRKL